MHPGCKNENTIKYKIRETEVPERHPLCLGEYSGGEILQNVSRVQACISWEGCSKVTFRNGTVGLRGRFHLVKMQGESEGKGESLPPRRSLGAVG